MSILPDCPHIRGAYLATGAPGPDQGTVTIPSDCERVPGNGGATSYTFFVWFYIDDGILVDVRFFQDGPRLRRAIESLASDQFRLLDPAISPPPV